MATERPINRTAIRPADIVLTLLDRRAPCTTSS